MIFIDKKFRAARIWSNDTLRKVAPHLPGAVINVSGWEDSDKQGGTYRSYFTNATQYDISNYPGERGITGAANEIELDLEQELPVALKQKYDVVFNHTTLEHIGNVEKAFANLCAMSKDAVIVVVPFLQEMHYTESFKDYWRFTPFALKRLFEQNGYHLIFVDANDRPKESVYVFAIGRRAAAKIPVEPAHDAFASLGGNALDSHNALYRAASTITRPLRRFVRF